MCGVEKETRPPQNISIEMHRNECPQCGLGFVAPIQMYKNAERYGTKSFVMECGNCSTKLTVRFDGVVVLKEISIASKDTEITW